MIGQVHPVKGAVLLCHVEIADNLLDVETHLSHQSHTLLRGADLFEKSVRDQVGGFPAIGKFMNMAQALAEFEQLGGFQGRAVEVNDNTAVVELFTFSHRPYPTPQSIVGPEAFFGQNDVRNNGEKDMQMVCLLGVINEQAYILIGGVAH